VAPYPSPLTPFPAPSSRWRLNPAGVINTGASATDPPFRGPEGSREIQTVIRTLSEHKAYDLVVLDLRQLSDATDYFVIASGSSDTHVRALADHVLTACGQEGRRPHHVEGLAGGRWVLIDFVDIVVHVFHPSLREFYQLERLWADAPTHSAGAHQS